MLRPSIGVCINGCSFDSILRSGSANASWVIQHILICMKKISTDKAISPRFAIRIEVKG